MKLIYCLIIFSLISGYTFANNKNNKNDAQGDGYYGDNWKKMDDDFEKTLEKEKSNKKKPRKNK